MGLTIKKVPKPITDLQMSAMAKVMGIDVSTDTGLVVLGWDAMQRAWRTTADFEINLPSLAKTSSMVQRLKRCSELNFYIQKALVEHKPKVIAIEGYGYANANSLVTMVELGMVVRMCLLFFPLTPAKLLEVAPTSLKKFVLGKGVGKKEQVMMQVFKRWGYEAKTNNLADAYALAQIAAANYSGLHAPVLTKPQKEVLAVVKTKNS